MIAWQSMLFLDYLPTTNDDLVFATRGIPWGAWWRQNRATLLISGHFIEFFSKSSFELRHLYGAHVVAFYAPLILAYTYLVSVSKRHIGLLAFAVAISYQVIGYEHTTPLAYPFTWSLGLSGIVATALFGGKHLARRQNYIGCIGYALGGALFASCYESFTLIFCILFVLAYVVEPDCCASRSLLSLYRAVLLGITPLVLILSSKLALVTINTFYPDVMGPSDSFGVYGGSSLYLSSPLLSLRVALNHFIGSTIIGHITSPLIWPPLTSYHSAPRAFQWSFAFLNSTIALFSFKRVFFSRSIVCRTNSNMRALGTVDSSLLLGIGFLLATVCMVLPAGFTAKYLSWLALSGDSWGHTFLTGSLSTSLGAVSISAFLHSVIDGSCKTLRRQRLVATVAILAIFAMSQRTFDHNYMISNEIKRRSDSLSDLIFHCRNDVLISPDAMAKFNTDLPNLPYLMTLCASVKSNPEILPNWGRDRSQYTMKDQWRQRHTSE